MYPVKNYSEIFKDSELPVIVTSRANIYYTTGFHTTARRPNQIGPQTAVMFPHKTVFICPKNWLTQILEQIEGNGVEVITHANTPAALRDIPLLLILTPISVTASAFQASSGPLCYRLRKS